MSEARFGNHLLCKECWNRDHPERPIPRLPFIDGLGPPCCRCGRRTSSGIYVRLETAGLLCNRSKANGKACS